MDDSYAGQVVVLIMSLLVMAIVFGAFGWVYMWSMKSLGALGKAVQAGAKRVGRTATNAGKKAAMNSKYGQAAQQFMGQRKSIAQLKGREALRDTLNKNPNLARLMGGVGGQQYASRFLNQENRKHEAEQIQELSKNMSLPMANAIAKGENLANARRSGFWANGTKLEPEDTEGIRQLQTQGYIGADGKVGAGQPHSAIAASAALQKLYNADDISAEKVAGLGSMLKGIPGEAGVEANANFTKLNSDLAVRGKNKNVAFASFNNGDMTQFHGKKPGGILDSGLNGMNKDALKYSNHDLQDNQLNPNGGNALLYHLRKEAVDANGNQNLGAVIERTKQTMDQSHKEVVEGLSYSLGFGNVNPEALSKMKSDFANREKAAASGTGPQITATERATHIQQVSQQDAQLKQQVETFQQLRRSMTSGSTTPPPPQFAAFMSGAPTPSPTPAPAPAAPPQPQLIVPHGPTGNGPTNRPRPSNFPPAGPPPPAGP